jgi:hypothetical protein
MEHVQSPCEAVAGGSGNGPVACLLSHGALGNGRS